MSNNIKQRNSSIELLRIFAMFMIIIHHYTVHGLFNYSNDMLGFNTYILSVTAFGEWAVNIFIVIFGYFGVKSKFNIKRITRLYVSVWLYSLAFFLVYTIINQDFSLSCAIRAFLPILGNGYWFFGKYIILCLLAPFLNKMIENITRQMHFNLIMLLLLSWSILPNILPEFMKYDLSITGSSIGAFILLYIIGSYLRLYPDCKANKTKYSWLIIIACVTFTLIYKFFGSYFNNIWIKVDCFTNVSIISIGFAVAAFCIFNKMSLKSNKIINEISLCTFGIYLIHDNDYMRGVLWHSWIKGYEYQNSPYMILHMLICAFMVFIVCLTIELIRKKTIDKLWIKFEEKHIMSYYERIRSKYDYTNKRSATPL